MFTMRLAKSISLSVAMLALITCAKSTAEEAASPSPPAVSSGQTQEKVFDFDLYKSMIDPLNGDGSERLCGLDQVCIDLWHKEKLEIYKDGRLFSGDFNGDGRPDEAIILEKDNPKMLLGKEFYILITSTDDDGKQKVLLHELLPNATNIVSTRWDKESKALLVDTGGRAQRSNVNVTQIGGPSVINETGAGQSEKSVISIVWNGKDNKFDVLTHRSSKKKK